MRKLMACTFEITDGGVELKLLSSQPVEKIVTRNKAKNAMKKYDLFMIDSFF